MCLHWKSIRGDCLRGLNIDNIETLKGVISAVWVMALSLNKAVHYHYVHAHQYLQWKRKADMLVMLCLPIWMKHETALKPCNCACLRVRAYLNKWDHLSGKHWQWGEVIMLGVCTPRAMEVHSSVGLLGAAWYTHILSDCPPESRSTRHNSDVPPATRMGMYHCFNYISISISWIIIQATSSQIRTYIVLCSYWNGTWDNMIEVRWISFTRTRRQYKPKQKLKHQNSFLMVSMLTLDVVSATE